LRIAHRSKWLGIILSLFGVACQSQPALETAAGNNTLLWEITGKGLKEPSYFYGTMHVLCPEDGKLSPSLLAVMDHIKVLYFEVDLDDMLQLFGSLKAMKMQDGTQLRDLLSEEDYQKVKTYFDNKGMLPFNMIENYKPMLLSGMIEEEMMPCKSSNGMELVIMDESNKRNLKVKGLETMAYQAGLFDSIPYDIQARELVKAIDSVHSNSGLVDSLLQTYRSQNLESIAQLTAGDAGIEGKYLDLLLYNRNRNWVEKFDTIAIKGATLFAVGAGHLPGENGVLKLLQQKGYTIRPIKNEMAGVVEKTKPGI
jgi:uncharacterized protein YbaP (TraB family)